VEGLLLIHLEELLEDLPCTEHNKIHFILLLQQDIGLEGRLVAQEDIQVLMERILQAACSHHLQMEVDTEDIDISLI